MIYPNLIKKHYPDLHGKDWIRRLHPDDRAALIHIGLTCADYGRAGGQARAKSATRDARGRFTKVQRF